MQKYKFSVIMPIYNVEKYIEDAIKSIINQSIGFEDNIQLILVNDGSTDKSENICIKYKNLYPENITYIKQKNQGVASARNSGIQYIQGKYTNFLDPDDKWNYDVFDIVYDFFEQHQNEINLVACRMKCFENQTGYHTLDYKFESNQIVDITEKYDFIQLSSASVFIKSELLKEHKYDTRLKYSEDGLLIGQILLESKKYGILSDAVYNYRKRKNKTSAIQKRSIQKRLLFNADEIEYVYKTLINLSKKYYNGQVIPYIQYHIMYDIQWKIREDISDCLSDDERDKYINKLKEILQYIEDYIIMEQRNLGKEYKIIVLSLKYNEDVKENLRYEKGALYYKDIEIYKIVASKAIKIDKIYIHMKSIVIVGKITYFLPKEDYKLYINIDDENYLIEKYKIFQTKESIIRKLNHYRQFTIKIPIKSKKTELRFVLDYKGNKNNLQQRYYAKDELKNKISLKKWGVTVKGEKEKIIVKKRKRII